MRAQHGTVFKVTAGFVLVHPRHDICPAGHADRGRIVVIIENHAVRREPVQVRGLGIRVAVAAHGDRGLVIRKQEDQVWASRSKAAAGEEGHHD